MKRYQSPIPRATLALAAVALTALTVGAWVIAPAKMEPGSSQARALALSAPASAQVASVATRIEVVAVRQPSLATVLLRHFQTAPKHKQAS